MKFVKIALGGACLLVRCCAAIPESISELTGRVRANDTTVKGGGNTQKHKYIC
jgi:hypothetical protein